MKISAIDIGSNSVRLALCEGGKTLYKALETTRLGKDISFTGELNAEAIERTAVAVDKLVRQAKADGAQRLYAFATEAVRSAKNRDVFLKRVTELCGVQVDVLSGETEAECGLLGALKGNDGGIIDVGGASTEVTVQSCAKKLYTKSVNIGTVRLFDLAGRNIEKLKAVIADRIKDYGVFSAENYKMYAIGGTATTIASVKHGLKVYDPQIIDGTEVTADEIYGLADKLLSLSVEEVRALDGMEPRRADVIGGGCLLLAEVMKNFRINKITVSESDNIEGYLMLKRAYYEKEVT